MKFGIIGTSRITDDHIKVIKRLGHDILFISSTRKKVKKSVRFQKNIKSKESFLIGKRLLNLQRGTIIVIF